MGGSDMSLLRPAGGIGPKAFDGGKAFPYSSLGPL